MGSVSPVEEQVLKILLSNDQGMRPAILSFMCAVWSGDDRHFNFVRSAKLLTKADRAVVSWWYANPFHPSEQY